VAENVSDRSAGGRRARALALADPLELSPLLRGARPARRRSPRIHPLAASRVLRPRRERGRGPGRVV